MGVIGEESEVVLNDEFEKEVVAKIKTCQQRNEAPIVWAVEVAKYVVDGVGMETADGRRPQRELPSVELGEVLVSQLCFSNNNPSLWKFLHQALSSGLLLPLHVLALLTSRVIPHRWHQPEAYRLYLELLSRFTFSFDPVLTDSNREKMIKSIDASLQLYTNYGVQIFDLGQAMVMFFFCTVTILIDSIVNDWTSQRTSADGASGATKSLCSQNTGVSLGLKCNERVELMRRVNSYMAMEVLSKLTDNRKALILLRLVHLNMPENFNGLLQKLQFLEAHVLSSSNLQSASQLLMKLSSNIREVSVLEHKLRKHQLIGMLSNVRSCNPFYHFNSEAGRFSCWVAFDICMENAMDGKQYPITSAIDTLTEMMNTLRVFNDSSWQETFLALWLSALRMVQRERDPLEGPVPHLEARLCILLSIVPLAIDRVLKDDCISSHLSSGALASGYKEHLHTMGNGTRRHGLVSSLQLLGQYHSLLCPPASVVHEANNAASNAASFISKTNNTRDAMSSGGDVIVKAGGDMRHLIVEACISRKLIDTSVYFWPGYVSSSTISLSDPLSIQRSCWSTFMEGAQLTSHLIDALITTPASSLDEIEKLYHIALNGVDEEKSAAAKILCAACLSRGWNIQEHVVRSVVKLLTPPIPPNFSGSRSYLVDFMPMLNEILSGAASIDNVHILSLHGVVPEVAASLMPLCEAFGSVVPASSRKSCVESSVYMVFSAAFLFLLRLWKFYRPLEQCITGQGGALGGELTLEYLLLLRNSRIHSTRCPSQDEQSSSMNINQSLSNGRICIESYPKLRAWYCQNKSCMASTLSVLCNGSPLQQVVDKILTMIFWKMTKSGTFSGNSPAPSTSTSGSPSDPAGDAFQIPMLSAWEVLEAIPFVLEAMLTACAHGILSPRDLTTGLRDLVDFLPAALAAIISFFSAEVTRGIWKPVQMNGTDWPSPAANLVSIESEIEEILAAAGVNVPAKASGGLPVMLPLPMAALVSLTITFKLDNNLEYIHAVVGPALENCSSSCPWSCMPIISSLWAQKVRRWHDFIVVSCCRSVFRQSEEAVAQILRSCFSAFLGSIQVSNPPLTGQNGVNGLLGTCISSPGLYPRVAPGFLYLRSCRTVHRIQYVNDMIVKLVAEFSRDSTLRWATTDSHLKSTRASLSVAISTAKEVATLGASFLSVAGGLQLVPELYQETIPTWLLSAREEKSSKISDVSRVIEGYTMAYLLVLCGAFTWGVGANLPPWTLTKRSSAVGNHMDFVAEVLNGNISLGCDPATWKAYVSCLVGLIVSFVPMWIKEVKQETLKTVANGLRGWHECELALSLLERGGVASMGSVAELLNVI